MSRQPLLVAILLLWIGPASALLCAWPAYWQGWHSWSSCSTSCGSGSQTRYRDCSFCLGACNPGVGREIVSRSCTAGPRDAWTAWRDSGSCSVLCGSGTQKQTRSCVGCWGGCGAPPGSTWYVSCQGSGSQKAWGSWFNYGGCSTSCGVGSQTQHRSCNGDCGGCSGASSREVTCRAGGDKAWTSWRNVGGCSNSCGSGTQTQTRTCSGCLGSCSGSDTREVACSVGNPRDWTAWQNSGSCDTACGYGSQLQVRACVGTCGSCSGASSKYVACSAGAAKSWGAWRDAGGCSEPTCGSGTQAQTRTCGGCLGSCAGSGSRDVACTSGPARAWAPWEYTAACSTSCGTGTRSQARACEGCYGSCAGASTQSVACSAGPAKAWTPWFNATGCNVTCGRGMLRQTRTCDGCLGACTGISSQYAVCVGALNHSWSAWQFVDNRGCPATCQRDRMRQCLGCSGPLCVGPANDTVTCIEGAWTPWILTSNCSATCGDGVTGFARNCTGCATGCPGASTKTEPCSAGVFRAWSAWANTTEPCNTTCGLGKYPLRRTCDGCQGPCNGSAVMYLPCAAGASKAWGSWTFAGACSQSCGEGQRPQTRSCDGCLGTCDGPATQFAPCAAGAPRVWGPWTDTSVCSVACDRDANKSQSRTCGGCIGACPVDEPATRDIPCFEPIERAWGPWVVPLDSECSTNCDVLRSRKCIGCVGPPCVGPAEDPVPCLVGVWSDWIPDGNCSDTCGTQHFTRECLGCPSGCSGLRDSYEVCLPNVTEVPMWTDWTCCRDGWKQRTDVCNLSSTENEPCTAAERAAYDCAAASISGSGSRNWAPVVIAVVLIALIVLFVALLVRRQRAKQKGQVASLGDVNIMSDNPLYRPDPPVSGFKTDTLWSYHSIQSESAANGGHGGHGADYVVPTEDGGMVAFSSSGVGYFDPAAENPDENYDSPHFLLGGVAAGYNRLETLSTRSYSAVQPITSHYTDVAPHPIATSATYSDVAPHPLAASALYTDVAPTPAPSTYADVAPTPGFYDLAVSSATYTDIAPAPTADAGASGFGFYDLAAAAGSSPDPEFPAYELAAAGGATSKVYE